MLIKTFDCTLPDNESTVEELGNWMHAVANGSVGGLIYNDAQILWIDVRRIAGVDDGDYEQLRAIVQFKVTNK